MFIDACYTTLYGRKLLFIHFKMLALSWGRPLLIFQKSFLIFGTWSNGSVPIPTTLAKSKSNVLVIMNTQVNSLVDVGVIKVI